ncbi:PREDICTED: AP-4 complex subunit epsilon-1-like [Thamnophis sirtalis]|uniref:AP-4 complex subunit epsilon-1-like n=1 Tax=Thamnophis sirtalis TaxID=35019 RepID=A0A6I9YZY2_9SAUR|nr:PREDICTED: AP-4 complex subunit epsilon-1-like [Thamnophis sirtalis]
MYDVLDESLRRAEINHNITYAILFECVHTIYTIHPKPDLFEKAAKCIGKFVLSPKINLKYLGLKALTYVIQQDPSLALQHQMTIIECLEHPDPIIKRETLELLYRITNEQNVTVIVQKMLDYINQSKEEYTIINIAGKIAELAEKYAPNNEWFIRTMNAVFSVGGDKMHPDILNSFLRLLAEGFEDEKEDIQLRFHAVQSYLALLEDKNAVYPQKFLQVMSWVLGEYSYLLQNVDPEVVLASLYRILKSHASCESKAWIMAAISKIASRTTGSKTVERFLLEFNASLDASMRQQAFELKYLCENKELMKRLFPLDASCKDIVVDASLSFLDGFVAKGLDRGALPYKPHHQRQEEKLSQEKALNFEPYGESLSRSFSASRFTGRQSPTGVSLGSDNSVETGQKENNSLKLEGMGKADPAAQRFTQKSKANEALPNESSPPMESTPAASLFQEGLTGKKDLFVNNGHLKFRKASLHSPEVPESKAMLDRSHSFPEVWKEDRLLIFLFLANKSPSILKDVNLELQHSEHFKMVENFGCQLAVIEGKTIESFQMRVEMEKPCSLGKIFGCISYLLELDVQLRFSFSLELLDFIR